MITPRNSAMEKLTDEELETIHQLAMDNELDQEFIKMIAKFLNKRNQLKNADND